MKIPTKTKVRRTVIVTGVTILGLLALTDAARAVLGLIILTAVLWKVGRVTRRVLKGKPAARPTKLKRPTAKPAIVPTLVATDIDATTAAIRVILKTKTGRAWSVTSPAKGQNPGTIRIFVPPIRREHGGIGIIDQAALTRLLGHPVGPAGFTVPATQAGRLAVLVTLQRARSLV